MVEMHTEWYVWREEAIDLPRIEFIGGETCYTYLFMNIHIATLVFMVHQAVYLRFYIQFC
jgi:hypothetical protein